MTAPALPPEMRRSPGHRRQQAPSGLRTGAALTMPAMAPSAAGYDALGHRTPET